MVLTVVSALASPVAGQTVTGFGYDWRFPIHVTVDRDSDMYIEGERVDTLLVYRGQIIYFEKHEVSGPDLTVQFERKLFHRRNRVRVILTEEGKPRFVKVDYHARMKVHFGTPEKGFLPDLPAYKNLKIRVVPPPKS
jgi:hypothetical protein